MERFWFAFGIFNSKDFKCFGFWRSCKSKEADILLRTSFLNYFTYVIIFIWNIIFYFTFNLLGFFQRNIFTN